MFSSAQRRVKFSSDNEPVVDTVVSGSTDSTLTDVTLTSAVNSPGNTSNSSFSIPWAEDAIRQNKELWEQVERMLYGECELPSDEGTRTELLEWMTAFPHIRVVGESCKVNYTSSSLFKPSDPNYDEVLAMHPYPGRNGNDPDNSQNKITNYRNINLDLRDCLKISSGPVGRRSAVVLRRPDNQIPIKPMIEKVKTIELDGSGRVTRNSVIYRHMTTPTRSAHPPADIGFLIRNSGGQLDVSKIIKAPSSKSATYRVPLSSERRRLVLPSINITPASFDSGIVGRSISATAVHSRKHFKRKDVGRLPNLDSDDST